MDNAGIIWRFLWERLGNACGAAGLMGNLQAESALNPRNLQNSYENALGYTDDTYTEAVDSGAYSFFATDRAGYGLAQWTHPDRKAALLKFARKAERSIGSLEMQLDFLWQELGSQYKSVLNTLLTARTVREASDAVMTKFEVPADLSEENKARRAARGEAFFERFARMETADPEADEPTNEGTSSGADAPPSPEGKAISSAPAETPSEAPETVLNEKAQTIIRLAIDRIGCPYVYGAKGEIRNGRQVFDCRGFTWWLLQQVGITISPIGATTQYNTVADWTERGLARDMPDLVCCVFKYHQDDNKMAHTGMHIGGGQILHCTSNGGVKYGTMADKTWTHYAIPKGLYTPAEIDAARGGHTVRTLKQGCSGPDVAALQAELNALGHSCGTADGVFGSKTKLAVMAFQSAHGLKADGIVGAQTWEALEAAGDVKTQEPAPDPEVQPLKSYVNYPLDMAMAQFMMLAELLGYTVDARSGNVSPIDYQ